MRTLEEWGDAAECFIFGHRWTETRDGGVRCQGCGERR